jgi:hypothetical protein
MDAIHQALKAIKENDGFPGPLTPMVRAKIIGTWATVEVSPLTGLDIQWTLTTEGKKKLIEFNCHVRRSKKYKGWGKRGHPDYYTPDVVVPLTVEVLDALKAIRERGDPETTRLDILARIQRDGIHGAKIIKGGDGEDTLVRGSLAEFKDGVWTLTKAGLHAEAGHIRKSECAQFTGKVR